MSDNHFNGALVKLLDEHKCTFDAMLDQMIAMIRNETTKDDQLESISQCATAYSCEDMMRQSFEVLALTRPDAAETMPIELTAQVHDVFVAYLFSLCLHRLVWPT